MTTTSTSRAVGLGLRDFQETALEAMMALLSPLTVLTIPAIIVRTPGANRPAVEEIS